MQEEFEKKLLLVYSSLAKDSQIMVFKLLAAD